MSSRLQKKSALSPTSIHRHAYGKASTVASLLLMLSLIIILAIFWLNRQYVFDFIAYSRYQSTSSTRAIVTRTTMNDTGKFYFFASHPVLESTQAFNKECVRKESTSAILGCYTGTAIYIYDVKDERLDGIEDVTAAHETLHAIYERMSDSERATIDKLLEAEYAKRKDNKELAERMAFYDRNEAGERDNELHSILGTEFAGLDPKLEAHYAKYFVKRQAILDLYAQYANVFRDLKLTADAQLTKLKDLNQKIKNEMSSYNSDVKDLNAQIESFNARARSLTRSEFDAQRAGLLAQINQLAQTRDGIDADSNEYKNLLTQYNATADASKQLYDSIDSTLAPAPSV